MPRASKITERHRHGFALICADTRTAFSDVIDLLLIHNEQAVHGPQPRTTLNRVAAMLSVAAWERLVADIAELARTADPATFEPGQSDSRGHNRLGANRDGGRSTAVSALMAASDGVIPNAWRIRLATSGSGKQLAFGSIAHGLDPDLVELVDWWIDIRHKVAHRGLPQQPQWLEPTDAHDGRSINTTTARSAFTLFLQLADQTIRTICDTAPFTDPDLSLPRDWMTGAIRPQRGVADRQQLRLWHGRSLARK